MNQTITLVTLFQMGGVLMWPLLLMFIAVTTVIIERAVVFLLLDRDAKRGCSHALRIARKHGVEQAASYCRYNRHAWGKPAAIALSADHTNGLHVVKAQTQAALARLDSPLGFIDMVASTAPVLGFLGTVTGMITAFRSIAEASTVQLQLVASGLYEALLTTAFGLIISVVATLASHVFWHLSDRFATDLDVGIALLSESTHETA